MVNSMDGSIGLNGRAGGLSSPADQYLYQVLRGLADIILVGAETVRAEGYQAVRSPEPRVAELRKIRGQTEKPRLAIVSGSLNLDPTAGMFANHDLSQPLPLIYTSALTGQQHSKNISDFAEIVDLGPQKLLASTLLSDLKKRNVQTVLCEGGAKVNAFLLAENLIDEYCLAISPNMVGGSGGVDITGQVPNAPHKFELNRVLEEEQFLFCRYIKK